MRKNLLLIVVLIATLFVGTATRAQSVVVKIKQQSNLLKDVTLINPIKIDPNVVHDYVKISLDPALKDLHKTITIYDILGRVVTFDQFEGTEKQIFLQNISHGLYFMKIDSPEMSIVSKFEVD